MLFKLWFNKYIFYLSSLLLIAFFGAMRLSYFLYYPAVKLTPDTVGYIELSDMIKAGLIPEFSIRTPGYPLFFALITSVFDSWLAVVVAQNLITLAAALCMVYAVYRLRRSLTFPVALAMAGFVGSTESLYYDSYLMTDSLYTSFVILMFSFLLLSFALYRALYFGVASAFMAAVIFVRPSGLYLIVVYLLILAYLLWNRYGKSLITGFLVPFPALLLLLCTYNYLTFHTFTISAFGEVNLALATISFWTPDPEFPPEVNQSIEDLPDLLSKRVNFKYKDRRTLNTSWDPYQLYDVFFKAYNASFYDYAYGVKFETPQRRGYIENRDLVRKVTFSSIKKHPDLYAKFVWANSVHYFLNITERIDVYEYQVWMISDYRQLVEDPSNIPDAYANHPSITPIVYTAAKEYVKYMGENADVISENAQLKSLRTFLQFLQWNIFKREIWIWAYLITLGLSVVFLAISKGRQLGAFILFILTISVIGSNLITALVETAFSRYAYPTQFIYYISVALLPLLRSDNERKPPGA